MVNDRIFQRCYVRLPFEVPDARFRKATGQIDGGEGIHPSTKEGLAKLKPVANVAPLPSAARRIRPMAMPA
ncbi:hypothetical protein [Pseudorhodoplanes sinuspersici]|uniref:Uncharacterized protein n=1 Tax=Pseudorhodoplanes sinuspersici TaxID=1235591 RepID=A0A1W6ZLS4_9HYPH|nr:hypothetical protein [Pseudorhodoplanes sinuspersici]ARP98225.1 hypothetical protein CAK95_03315 [Pseudorhodoplanes sinuspersici]